MKTVVCTAALAAFTLAACSGSSKGDADITTDIKFTGDAPDGSVDVSQSYAFVDLCDRWAEACCHVLTCQGSSPTAEEELCVATQRVVCEHDIGNLLGSHIDLGAIDYQPANAEACWAPLIAATCDALDAVVAPAECGAIVLGSAAAGASCDFDAICAAGLFCDANADGTCPGTCAPRVADGAVCDQVHARCLEGSRCLSTFLTGLDDAVCGAENRAPGQGCIADIQCHPAGYCNATEERCEALQVDGAACDDGGQCASGACSPSTQKCGPPPTGGQACDFICADGFVCLREEHTCVAGPSQAGDDCVAEATFPCGLSGHLQCEYATGKCVGPLPLGAPCGGVNGVNFCDDGYCSGDFQTAGTCQPVKQVGDPCEESKECGIFLTCRGDGTCGLFGDPCRGAPLDGLW